MCVVGGRGGEHRGDGREKDSGHCERGEWFLTLDFTIDGGHCERGEWFLTLDFTLRQWAL